MWLCHGTPKLTARKGSLQLLTQHFTSESCCCMNQQGHTELVGLSPMALRVCHIGTPILTLHNMIPLIYPQHASLQGTGHDAQVTDQLHNPAVGGAGVAGAAATTAAAANFVRCLLLLLLLLLAAS